jgi:hypothetical protein
LYRARALSAACGRHAPARRKDIPRSRVDSDTDPN